MKFQSAFDHCVLHESVKLHFIDCYKAYEIAIIVD